MVFNFFISCESVFGIFTMVGRRISPGAHLAGKSSFGGNFITIFDLFCFVPF